MWCRLDPGLTRLLWVVLTSGHVGQLLDLELQGCMHLDASQNACILPARPLLTQHHTMGRVSCCKRSSNPSGLMLRGLSVTKLCWQLKLSHRIEPAQEATLESTPIQMPPESGGICGRLEDLPLGCLQGGEAEQFCLQHVASLLPRHLSRAPVESER